MRQAASWGYLSYGYLLKSDFLGRMVMVARKPLEVVAGFPAGTFNVATHAPGQAVSAANAFFKSRTVRCINLTGSGKTARVLGEQAGRSLKRLVLE